MVLSTPEENYDIAIAKNLLDKQGPERVEKVVEHLKATNVITRVVSDPEKSAPGREWKFQEWYVV